MPTDDLTFFDVESDYIVKVVPMSEVRYVPRVGETVYLPGKAEEEDAARAPHEIQKISLGVWKHYRPNATGCEIPWIRILLPPPYPTVF